MELDACYGELASCTQQPEGRRQVAESPVLHRLTAELPSTIEIWQQEQPRRPGGAEVELLHLLRILRNLCACGTAVTKELLAAGIPSRVAGILESSSGSLQLIKVATQLLANLSGSGKTEAQAVWDACWPIALGNLAAFHPELVEGPLCMILYTCCAASEAAVPALTGRTGLKILQPLLELFSHPQDIGNVHLEMLIPALSFSTGSLPGLAEAANQTQTFLASLRDWHAGMLHAVTEAIDAAPSTQSHRLCGGRGDDLAVSVFRLVDNLAARDSDLNSSQVLFLQTGLKFLRSLTAKDDEGASLANGRKITSLLIAQHQLLKALLAMLAALGPLQSLRPDKQQQASWPLSEGLDSAKYKSQQPYPGYRTDILAVLANTTYRRREAHEEVQRLGGVELVLAHCQVAEDNPFLRETALWGVRNLCEGNVSIQKQIEELQVMGVVDSPELRKAGKQLQLDPATSRLELIDSINH